MSSYGHCGDCGTTMERWGCPNCNSEDVEPMLNTLADSNWNTYPDWSQD